MSTQSPSQKALNKLEKAMSKHLVQMIDIFFALVLGQGIVRYANVLASPFNSNLTVCIALLAIYYTVVRSFVAWHFALEYRHYKISTVETRTTELWRVYVDGLIVVMYAYLLLAAEPLKSHSSADIRRLLWGFPVLFVLYCIWGLLLRASWGKDEFDLGILGAFCAIYVIIAAGYTVALWGKPSIVGEHANAIVLTIVFALMILYRYINFWQGYDDRQRARWHCFPRPRRPHFRALASRSEDGS